MFYQKLILFELCVLSFFQFIMLPVIGLNSMVNICYFLLNVLRSLIQNKNYSSHLIFVVRYDTELRYCGKNFTVHSKYDTIRITVKHIFSTVITAIFLEHIESENFSWKDLINLKVKSDTFL